MTASDGQGGGASGGPGLATVGDLSGLRAERCDGGHNGGGVAVRGGGPISPGARLSGRFGGGGSHGGGADGRSGGALLGPVGPGAGSSNRGGGGGGGGSGGRALGPVGPGAGHIGHDASGGGGDDGCNGSERSGGLHFDGWVGESF